MPNFHLKIETDAAGGFHVRHEFQPPFYLIPILHLPIELRVTLLTPQETVASFRLQINEVERGPFSVSTGQEVALGTWRFDRGTNIIVLKEGTTEPARRNTRLEFNLVASPALLPS